MKQLKNERGLTLVELLAVIVILAIIAAIAAVAIGNVISNSKDKAILSDAANIIAGAKIAYMDGVCEEGKECKAAQLKGFVENVTLSDEVEVTQKNNEGEVTYSIKYPEFKKIKADKYLPKIAKGTTGPADEKDVLDAMNGKGEPKKSEN